MLLIKLSSLRKMTRPLLTHSLTKSLIGSIVRSLAHGRIRFILNRQNLHEATGSVQIVRRRFYSPRHDAIRRTDRRKLGG